jgi:uncharacterized protein
MPEYLAPGVYVEEVEIAPRPIEGVGTSTAGFVGMTVRGDDAAGPPVLVTSFADFQRKFGGYFDQTAAQALAGKQHLPYAVSAFFENGGRRLFVKRVPGTNAVAAAPPTGSGLTGGLTTRLVEDASGSNTIKVASTFGIQNVAAPNAVTVTLEQTKEGVTKRSTATAVTGVNDTDGTVTLAAPLGTDFDARLTTVRTNITNTTPVQIVARDRGKWGESIVVQIVHDSLAFAQVDALVETTAGNTDWSVVRVNTTANFYPGAIVEFNRGNTKVARRISSVSGNSLLLDEKFAASTDLDPQIAGRKTTVRTCEFTVIASYEGLVENIGPLALDQRAPNYYEDRINHASTLVRASGGPLSAGTTANLAARLPSAPDGLTLPLRGGSDGTTPGDPQYVGTDGGPGNRTGIRALEDIDEVAIVAAPGITAQSVQNALISQCENLMDRFAILDPEYASGTALTNIQNQRQRYDTKYAALYFPRLRIDDPVTDVEIAVPPSGHIAGIYARTDNERGVHKAPANVVPRGITGLDVIVTKGEQEILNPKRINVIRDFRADNRGIRVWGARCLTSDSPWMYINVRRLFIYIEESLDEGTQAFVFEPNDEKLWARVRQTVSIFLTRVWRDGALFGSTPEEAFFVRCDETTMSTDDIENGRLIMEIGVAPVKPAEFVVIRIGQFPGGTAIEEL